MLRTEARSLWSVAGLTEERYESAPLEVVACENIRPYSIHWRG